MAYHHTFAFNPIFKKAEEVFLKTVKPGCFSKSLEVKICVYTTQ